MDQFVQTLSLQSNQQLNESNVEACARILLWLQIKPHMKLTPEEVQIILKALLYFNEHFVRFGCHLHSKLKEKINSNYLRSIWSRITEESAVVYFCKKIMHTQNSAIHIPILEKFFSTFLSENEFKAVLKGVHEESCSSIEDTSNSLDMEAEYFLQRLFQLKPSNIFPAIECAALTLDFGIIAKFFLEKPETCNYKKAAIVGHKICNMLNDFSMPFKFFQSMHKVSSKSDDGLYIYFQVLRVPIFAESIVHFYIHYLTCLENKAYDDGIRLNGFRFDTMSFLMTAALSKNSPCRACFRKELQSSSIKVDVIKTLNKLDFIFDF